MHLLFNSPSQQAALTKYMHALAHARPHNLRYKHTEWEMNMEMKTKQVCKYLVSGTGDGLLGTAKSMVNRGWLCSCSFVHVTAVQMFACLTVQRMHANVCFYCVWEFIGNVLWGQQQFVPQLHCSPLRTGLEMSFRSTPSVTQAILIKVVCVNSLINNHCVGICAQRQKSPT